MILRNDDVNKNGKLNGTSTWLLNKFSLLAPREINGEQYREYLYWCTAYRDFYSDILPEELTLAASSL